MLRPHRDRCAYCGAAFQSAMCVRCREPRYAVGLAPHGSEGPLPSPLLGGLVSATSGLVGVATVGPIGAVLGLAGGVLTLVGVPLALVVADGFAGRRVDAAIRRRAMSAVEHASDHETVRGRVHVLASATPSGAAASRAAGATRCGRFEVRCDAGASILCDDDVVVLSSARFGAGTIELREGDLVVADGPVREIPADADYRGSGVRLAFDGRPDAPVRIVLEARA